MFFISQLSPVCVSDHRGLKQFAAVLSSSDHDYHVTVSPKTLLLLFMSSLSTASASCVCACVCFNATHYDTVLSNVDIGADLCSVDHAVLFDEDVVSDV